MITLDGINLTNFVHANPYDYNPNVADLTYTASGGLLVELSTKLSGKPILLVSDMEPTALFEQVFNHANNNLNTFVLDLNGNATTVMWDFTKTPVSATPLQNFADNKPDYVTNINLHLIEINA